MINFKLTTLSIIYIFCSTSYAYAYLDPGTGSIILQAILAFLAGAAATISLWWFRVKSFFKKIFNLDKTETKTSDKD